MSAAVCSPASDLIETDIIDTVSPDAAGSGPLIGRDEDLGRLVAAAGVPGNSGLVVLSGDAGIGKTRLLTELVEQARGEGATALVGHCPGEGGSALPYLPLTEMLGRLEVSDPEILQGADPQPPTADRPVARAPRRRRCCGERRPRGAPRGRPRGR